MDRQSSARKQVPATRGCARKCLSELLQMKKTQPHGRARTDEPDHHCSHRPTAVAALGTGTNAQPHERRHSPSSEISGPNICGKPEHQHNERPATGAGAADAQPRKRPRSPSPEISNPRRSPLVVHATPQSRGTTTWSGTVDPGAPSAGENCVSRDASLTLAHANTATENAGLMVQLLRCEHPGCTYTTCSRDNLTNHTGCHTGERPFICPDPRCGMAYARRSTLNNHKKRPHDTCTLRSVKRMMTPQARQKRAEGQQMRWIRLRQSSAGKPVVPTPSSSLSLDPGRLVNENTTITATPEAVRQRPTTGPTTGAGAAHAYTEGRTRPRSLSPEIAGPRRIALAAHANVQFSGTTTISRTADHNSSSAGENCASPDTGLTLADGNTATSNTGLLARPFQCEHAGCTYSTRLRKNFSNHTRCHTGEKPFICPDPRCGMAFTQRSTLDTHKKRLHDTPHAVKRLLTPQARQNMCESQKTRWIRHRQSSVGIPVPAPRGSSTPDLGLLVNEKTATTPEAVPQPAEVMCEVERILGMLKAGRTVWYLTKWKGFDPSHNSWKEASEMKRAWQSIKDFILEFGKATAENPKILSPEGQAWLSAKHPAP